jgi:hypothetical protein
MLKKINAMAEFNRWCSIEVTVAGPNLLAANFSVNCLRPAVGQKFFTRARVVKPGKMQVFTSCVIRLRWMLRAKNWWPTVRPC